MDSPTRKEMMQRLEFFLGTWTVEVIHPHLRQSPISGTARFIWLEGTYIVQHTQIGQPEFPTSTIIYDWDAASGEYVQHYFDSRGVTRLYRMRFGQGEWELRRDSADFSPLDFHQRFRGALEDNGNSIDGVWEQSSDGHSWNHDFRLFYGRN